ncbi:MAG: TM2 domain-containing protein [Oscillospiraceae bacterium]|jgi:restriction system protein|nr:TM2 domain-containing protein [Oscillospiraceae bacterium]
MKSETTEKTAADATKFCKHCGEKIDKEAVICVKCGKQVEELAGAPAAQPQIVISNTNTNTNANINANPAAMKRPRNKWTAFFLCLFLGYLGAHKFYEGRGGMGALYLLTGGLFGVGWLIDLIALLCKPNPYYI